ncbi:growth hormone-regulated TBC protein 1-like [Clavelina lepadiformis]|uniref:growth hormone-regulated TBC protein 1-like n=1 Tax=Clavelina lepadiformis TaxID=159417 RepID=UPI004041CD6A
MIMASTSNMNSLKAKYTQAVKQNTVGTLSKVDPYGFERGNDFDYKAFENFESEYLAVLARRTIKWDKMMKNGTKRKVKPDRVVKRFCRKGIPERYRARVWMDVSGARKKMKKSQKNFYQTLLEQPNQDADFEEELTESIKTDLDRTFPDNIHFKNGIDSNKSKQKDLLNILTAFGRHSPTIGYCQGMNYIAALLLIVVKDPEQCFWLLCALIDDILPAYYTKSMIGLRAEMNVIDDLVREKFPEVQQKIDVYKVPWTLVASKWFVCLFVDVVPTETVLRVWDCLFFEGSKVLIRAALCIIYNIKPAVLSCKGMPDVVQTFKDVSKNSAILDCHLFMQQCFIETNPLTRADLKKLREKNRELIEEEDEKYSQKQRKSRPSR